MAVLSVFTAYYSFRQRIIKSLRRIIKFQLTVNVAADIKWFQLQGKARRLLSNSKIAMILENGKVLGENEKVRKATVSQLDDIIRPVVANKKSEITDNCNILTHLFQFRFFTSVQSLQRWSRIQV